jgi:hypothetical protein
MPYDYLLLPSLLTASLILVATCGLLVMYHLRHNRAIIGIVAANLWLLITYALDINGASDVPMRIVMLRAGLSLLEFAFLVGTIVFIVRRAQSK